MTKKHILNISLTLSHFKSFYYKIKSLENDCIFYASPTLPPFFFLISEFVDTAFALKMWLYMAKV